MDKISLEGVVDMHVHASPDLRPRRYDDFELCEAAAGVGARAVVLKSHLGDTTARAYLANRRNLETHPDSAFQAVGSVTLNRCVGGINPEAVENALNLGAKVVWHLIDYTLSARAATQVNEQLSRRQRGRTGGMTNGDD